MDGFFSYFNLIAFLFFTALIFAALLRELRFDEVSAAEKELPAGRTLVLLFFFGALILRLWGFGLIPGGVNQDGVMAAVDGKALADYGTDRFGTPWPAHLYAWGYGQMSSLLSYLIAAFVKLFGLSTVTMRLPQLLASMMGAVCFYVFVRDAFGRRAGLIAAALVAINPWHMMQSRWALDCNLLPHFFIAGICFLQRGLNGRRIWLYVSMLFFGLCMYCYGIAVYTVSLFLLFTGIYLAVKRKLRIGELLGCALIWLLVSWPFILTMAINYFKWETISLPFVTMQYFPGSVRSGDILFFSKDLQTQLVSNLRSFANVVLLQKKDLPWNDMQGFGTMYLFSLPLALGGVRALFKSRGNGKCLAVAGLLTGVWAGLVTNNVNINRANLVFYFVLLLIVLGLDYIIAHYRQALLPSAAIFLYAGVMLAGSYFGDYADNIKHYFYWGFGEALQSAEESGAERIYVTADAQGEGYWNVSEILTLYYDQTDAEYFQGRSNYNKGEELLPYRQRFSYVSMDESTGANAPEGTAFVIKASDVPFFPQDKYALTYFGDFACATEK